MVAYVLLDIGNQRTKWTRFTPPRQTPPRQTPLTLEPQQAVVAPEELPELDQQPLTWLVCSVNRARCREWQQWVATNRPADRWREVTFRDIPLQLLVKNPERVGTDRLLACYGARRISPVGGPLIVIDSGTAVTIDVLSANDEFLGGLIFPGIRTSLKALKQNTDALPELEFEEFPNFVIGDSTATAIHAGVFHSQVGAIRHIVDRIQTSMGPHQVILAGGGMRELLSEFPPSWLFVHDLVLQGLADLASETNA